MAKPQTQRYSSLEPKRVRLDGTLSRESETFKRQNSSSAYETYKASLHAFFDGKKPLPEHLRERLKKDDEVTPAPIETNVAALTIDKSAEKKGRRVAASAGPTFSSLLNEVQRSTTSQEITSSVDALLLAGYNLPDNEELLSKALAHNRDAVVEQVLIRLKTLHANNPPKSSRLLKTRLENVALMTSSSEVRTLCQELRQMIG